jgi:FKBP-type peptidyl-prolyl cis-trans isomerase FkpA/FKBP-type peptidyl-prolyl cis-trans isomerase FklB
MPATIRSLIGLIVIALVSGCQPPAGEQPDIVLESEDEKTIYSMGLALAQNLSAFGLSDRELQVLQQGLEDGVHKNEPKVDLNQYRRKIQELQRSRLAKMSETEKRESAAFLEKEAAAPGAERTASGLIYVPIQEGEGESPTENDTVRVHYEGTLRDGTVFDSSRKRGTPFVTKLTSVIACWREGLQKMKPGGKARLVCPSEIAYGDRGSANIKPGAALAFDVELIQVVK